MGILSVDISICLLHLYNINIISGNMKYVLLTFFIIFSFPLSHSKILLVKTKTIDHGSKEFGNEYSDGDDRSNNQEYEDSNEYPDTNSEELNDLLENKFGLDIDQHGGQSDIFTTL